MDTEQLNKPAQPYEFRAKKTWQKAFMISAGVIMNVILAFVIYFGLYLAGKEVASTRTIAEVEKNSIAEQAGFKPMDEIKSVNGVPVTTFDQAGDAILFLNTSSDKHVIVNRGGNDVDIQVAAYQVGQAHTEGFGVSHDKTRPQFQAVLTFEPAGRAGFKENDIVLAVNDENIYSRSQFQKTIEGNKEKEISITVLRNNAEEKIKVTPNSNGKIGVQLEEITLGNKEKLSYGLGQSFSIGFTHIRIFGKQFGAWIGKMINGKVSVKESTGGVISIANTAKYGILKGAETFFSIMATLSLTLAILNILPIPVLDGGHLVFILLEGILRREISTKIKVGFQYAGFALLILFMIYVNFNDVVRNFFR